MEVVGGVLFPEEGFYGCSDNLTRMALRCPDSYAWCQTVNNYGDDDLVPGGEPRINPGPGIDPDYPEEVICTMDAKGCPDGSSVGRVGPKCEFALCPGNRLKEDFVPTKENPIELPNNVISEKDCAAAGGEVWNTLGETSYSGELIGKVEGLLCPCACLVK